VDAGTTLDRVLRAAGRSLVVVGALLGCAAPALVAHAQGTPPGGSTPPSSVPATGAATDGAATDGTAPVGTSPVVVVPSGCARPALPDVVFLGTLVARDFRTARFAIDNVRAGDPTPFAVNGLIDVRYGNDVERLQVDEQYVVAAGVHPDLGLLYSQIREPAPPFGGDDVISVQESDVPCPVLEDPIRTLEPDGTSVESGVLTPLFEDRSKLLRTLGVPLAVAFAAVFVLAGVRLVLDAFGRGVRRLAGQRR
jgi:hypothetical protein